ncbi:MAG: hypothetical protein K2O24_03420 [Muribaculaceae bacterium]|nr:hypothetical protein [Muribaculaceae bacterium]
MKFQIPSALPGAASARRTLCKCALLGGLLVGIDPCAAAQDVYWHQRVSLFDKLPVSETDIVFLGNSITDGGEFAEMFGMENCINRGIRSDVINGVRKRLRQVTDGHPAKIFLLIGINDVSHGLPAEKIASNYEQLVKEIREATPETELYVQSVMPINNDFKRYKNLVGREDVIPALNALIKEIAVNNGATYIDLWGALADESGSKLRREFTNDGLHLTGAGYQAWAGAIVPYVKEEPAHDATLLLKNKIE